MNGISHGRRGILVAVSSGLVGTFVALGCARQDLPLSEAVRPVKTMIVAAGDQGHVRVFPGKVEASKKAVLAFQVPGVLVKLPVREGQKVAKGELIAQLRQDEFQARLKALQGQLDQARANLRSLRSGERPEQRLKLEALVRAARAKLANSQIEFNRASELIPLRAIAKSDYDAAQAAYHAAQEEYEAARQALEQGMVAREEDIDGQEVGFFREPGGAGTGVYPQETRLLPIVARPPPDERDDVRVIHSLQIWSPVAGRMIPLSQVTSGAEVVWENPVVMHRDRFLTLTVHATDLRHSVNACFLQAFLLRPSATPILYGAAGRAEHWLPRPPQSALWRDPIAICGQVRGLCCSDEQP
jgi:hypothetical protein